VIVMFQLAYTDIAVTPVVTPRRLWTVGFPGEFLLSA
jgi:hypothetical protein